MPRLWTWVNVEIRKRLVDRFDLATHPTQPDPLVLSGGIQPVTSIDELLRTEDIITANEDISAAAGTRVPFFTVPDGKRYTVKGIYAEPTTANTRNYVADSDGLHFWLDASGTSEFIDYKVDLKMPEGWTVGRTTTGNGADNSRNMKLIIEEEDAF